MTRGVLAVLTTLLLVACDREPPAHWMTDSGVPFVDYGLLWLDDDRVLFQRMEQSAARVDRSDVWSAFEFPLSTWSADDGLRTVTDQDVSQFCFAAERGVLSYLEAAEGEEPPTCWTGPPDADAMTGEPLAGGEETRMFNPFTCAYEPRPEPLIGHAVVPLRPGDGLVDFGPRREDAAARLLTDDGRSIELPFDRHTADARGFATDGKAYLVAGKEQEDARCRPVWRLEAGQGAQREACLPELGSSRIARTAVGWVLDKREYPRDGGIGDSGLFLVDAQGDLTKIAAGFTENLAVSPDGCRIAFGHAPDMETTCSDGSYKRKTLKTMDLCALEGEILSGSW